jgi:hypothetical protein
MEAEQIVRGLISNGVFVWGVWMVLLLLTLVSGCIPTSPPPIPEVASGAYKEKAGFEYLFWDEGLEIMVWHDYLGPAGSASQAESTPFRMDPLYTLKGYAQSLEGDRFDWEMQTGDGRTGQFWIDGRPYDLDEGVLFIVRRSNGAAEVTQLVRDLSGVQPYAESCVSFARGDPDLARFIEGMSSPTAAAATTTPNPTAARAKEGGPPPEPTRRPAIL